MHASPCPSYPSSNHLQSFQHFILSQPPSLSSMSPCLLPCHLLGHRCCCAHCNPRLQRDPMNGTSTVPGGGRGGDNDPMHVSPESTLVTDPTSAHTLAVRRPSPSSPTSRSVWGNPGQGAQGHHSPPLTPSVLCYLSPTSASTTRISPTSAPTATGRTRTQPRCRSTCLHMPSSMPRPIAAACVAVPTPR